MFDIIDLQLFSSAVNTTTKYAVNEGTSGSGSNRGNEASGTYMAAELKTFYDTELLENARQAMVYAQFGKKQALPARHGKTVEWRKWNTFSKASALEEGVFPTGQNFGMTTKTGTIAQYGTYASISDELELHAFDDIILGATEEMGASAAATQEELIAIGLLANSNVMYCDNITANSVTTPEAPSGLDASSGHAYLTPAMVNKAVTKMKKNKVPTINGKYIMVVTPSVAADLRSSSEWVEAHKYAATTEIFNGEIGELHGCRFIENADAPICGGTAYATGASGVCYANYMFGKDSFGIIDPEGGALQMIIHDKDEIGGPLNQFSTVGYKFESNGVTILYPERVLTVFSSSSYSATDTANYTQNT